MSNEWKEISKEITEDGEKTTLKKQLQKKQSFLGMDISFWEGLAKMSAVFAVIVALFGNFITLKKIDDDKQRDIQKEKRQIESSYFIEASKCLGSLLYKDPESSEYAKAREELFDDLDIKLRSLNYINLTDTFLLFRKEFLLYEKIHHASILADSLRDMSIEIMDNSDLMHSEISQSPEKIKEYFNQLSIYASKLTSQAKTQIRINEETNQLFAFTYRLPDMSPTSNINSEYASIKVYFPDIITQSKNAKAVILSAQKALNKAETRDPASIALVFHILSGLQNQKDAIVIAADHLKALNNTSNESMVNIRQHFDEIIYKKLDLNNMQ